jgi:hypothetical protein
VKIDLTIKDQTLDQIFLHMHNLTVNKFEISFGDKVYEGTSNLDESFVDHTYSFKFNDSAIKFEAKGHYKLIIEYEGNI